MSEKIKYNFGDKINGITFIKNVKPYINHNTKEKSRKALFQCPFCQKEFEVVISNVKNGNTKSCGCVNIKRITIHGLHKHPIYRVWAGIKRRCYNPNSHAYKHYGGRGITICNEWKNDFKAFYDWAIANGYKKCLEIDRRDNDGDYTPENCRFVNRHIQCANQRMRNYNTSGYVGVSWNKNEKKWQSRICVNNKEIHIGWFKEKLDAIQSRNNYIIKNNLTEYKIQSICDISLSPVT